MKTLVITGAARKNGHTNQMVQLFLGTLGGEYTVIDAYRAENIAPCKDCRYCWHKKGCSIHDGMERSTSCWRRPTMWCWPLPCTSTPSPAK